MGPILVTSAFAVAVATYNTAAMSGTPLALLGLKAFSFIPPAVVSAAWEPYSLVSASALVRAK